MHLHLPRLDLFALTRGTSVREVFVTIKIKMTGVTHVFQVFVAAILFVVLVSRSSVRVRYAEMSNSKNGYASSDRMRSPVSRRTTPLMFAALTRTLATPSRTLCNARDNNTLPFNGVTGHIYWHCFLYSARGRSPPLYFVKRFSNFTIESLNNNSITPVGPLRCAASSRPMIFCLVSSSSSCRNMTA